MKITLYLFCFLFTFHAYSYGKNDSTIKYYLNKWGAEYQNYNPETSSIVIGVSVKNCISCINPAINKIIDFVKKKNININFFLVFETDTKKESLPYKKKYKNCFFAEDYNNILINDFGLEEFPTLFIISADGRIVYVTDSLNKNIDNIINFIKEFSQTVNNNKLIKLSTLDEDDDYIIHDINQIIFNKEKFSVLLFEFSLGAIIEYDLRTGRYLNKFYLPDTLYKQFIDSTNKFLWDKIIGQWPKLVNYICLINGFNDLTFLAKIITGFRKEKSDQSTSNDSIYLTKISFCIVSKEQNGEYKIKLVLHPQKSFYYENILNGYYINNKIIFPITNKQIVWGGKPFYKNLDSIFYLAEIDYPSGNIQFLYPLKQIDSTISQFKLVDYLFCMDSNKLFYIDVNNKICFSSDLERQSIINKMSSKNLIDSSLEDVFFDDNIFLLYNSNKDSTIIIRIFDFQLNLKHNIILNQPVNDIISAKIIGISKNELLLLIKSKTKRWEVYKLNLS